MVARRVSDALQTMASYRIAIADCHPLDIPIAIAHLTRTIDGDWIAKVAIGAPESQYMKTRDLCWGQYVHLALVALVAGLARRAHIVVARGSRTAAAVDQSGQ
jgi:hypothetical protein